MTWCILFNILVLCLIQNNVEEKKDVRELNDVEEHNVSFIHKIKDVIIELIVFFSLKYLLFEDVLIFLNVFTNIMNQNYRKSAAAKKKISPQCHLKALFSR